MVLSFSNCSSRAISHGSSSSKTSCSTYESDKAGTDVKSGGGGVDILLEATVGVPVGGIFVASGAIFVERGGGVADGCTSDSSVKRQAAKTSSSTNSDVFTFKDISLIPPVAHSIYQLPTHVSQSLTRSHLTNHTTIYLVA
jgi:hypothetical protein